MTTLKVRFDGRVLVPETPVDLPRDRVLEISIAVEPRSNGATNGASTVEFPLAALADWAEQLPSNPDAPSDGAAQHDHYLYGTPKRR